MKVTERHLHRSRLLLALVATLAVADAHALQVIDASDGASVEAILSIQEPTRIRIEGTPITDVFGNIHSSSCAAPSAAPSLPGIAPGGTSTAGGTSNSTPPAVNPAGEIVLECDRDKGEIYVRPIGDGKKPVNLFVSSAKATYTLLLRRADTPADTIVIRDKAAKQRRNDTPVPSSTATSAASHVRTLKALLVAMAGDRVPSDIDVEEVGQALFLWREARFQLERIYRGRGFVGERYLIQNVSQTDMVLAEPEFDREGDESGSVAGIAIEHHNLHPGERTQVFVIRREARP